MGCMTNKFGRLVCRMVDGMFATNFWSQSGMYVDSVDSISNMQQ